MRSRFLSSCPYYIQLATKDWKLLRDEMCTCAFSLSICMSFLYTNTHERLVVGQGRVPLVYVAHTGTRCAPVPSRFSSSCRCYTKQKLRDWYLLKDEMRTCPFSLSILMSLFYKTRNERWQLLRDEILPEDSETVLSTLRTLHIYHRSFSVQVSLFVLVMTHCYWVLLRPPTKVGQSGGGSIYIYIYARIYVRCASYVKRRRRTTK